MYNACMWNSIPNRDPAIGHRLEFILTQLALLRMSRLVRCTCKAHCLEFDHGTQSYQGRGVLVPKSTAQRHRFDDLLAEQIDNTTKIVARHVLRHDPPADPVEGVPHVAVPYEAFHLETEIASRCSWTPSDRPLVFATTPDLNFKYQYPPPSEVHLPNHGTHALHPSDRANRQFLENESRLCEILINLERRPLSSRVGVTLADRVHEGLLRMRRHKETEWDRQKRWSIARSQGFAVVESGMLWTISFVCLMRRLCKMFISGPQSPIIQSWPPRS